MKLFEIKINSKLLNLWLLWVISLSTGIHFWRNSFYFWTILKMSVFGWFCWASWCSQGSAIGAGCLQQMSSWLCTFDCVEMGNGIIHGGSPQANPSSEATLDSTNFSVNKQDKCFPPPFTTWVSRLKGPWYTHLATSGECFLKPRCTASRFTGSFKKVFPLAYLTGGWRRVGSFPSFHFDSKRKECLLFLQPLETYLSPVVVSVRRLLEMYRTPSGFFQAPMMITRVVCSTHLEKGGGAFLLMCHLIHPSL